MGSRSTNTFSEWLDRLAQDTAQAMGLPDADLQFLGTMLDAITQKRRAPLDQVTQMMQQQQGGTPMPQGAPGGAMPMPAPGGRPPGVPGQMDGRPQMPNMNEIARMLGQ